jgi:16S rRNA (guanine966-N2)-methyltransferase
MRIVGGVWAGRDLVSPGSRVRPTAEEVRARWLDILAPHLAGARVLDLFAGSGALGLEALSRGAASADFVENGPASLHSLKANIAVFRLTKRTRVFKRDAIPFVEALAADAYDIAFADPPYGSRKADRVVKRWLEVPFSRILSVEHGHQHRLSGKGKSHRFGDTWVTIYRVR